MSHNLEQSVYFLKLKLYLSKRYILSIVNQNYGNLTKYYLFQDGMKWFGNTSTVICIQYMQLET